MEISRKTIIAAFVMGMLAMVGVLAVAAFGLGPGAANAADPTKTGGTPTNGQSATSGNQNGSGSTSVDYTVYFNLLEQNFAANLGVDQAKLDSSFTAAVNSTVDKALHDGALTQDQANQIKADSADGLKNWLYPAAKREVAGAAGDIAPGDKAGAGGDISGVDMGQLFDAAMTAGATLLKITPDDMALAVKRDNKSLTEIAQAHGVAPQTLQSTMLAAARSKADANVSSSAWTQTRADAAYSALTNLVNTLMTSSPATMNGGSTK